MPLTTDKDENNIAIEPWYKQFWPWFLIALPGTVVVAAIFTLYIAVKNPQPLVRSDYYKDGLAINKNMAKEQLAADSGLQAKISFSENGLVINTLLKVNDTLTLPEQLHIEFIHPADDKLDVTLILNPEKNNATHSQLYSGLVEDTTSQKIRSQRWYIQITPTLIQQGEDWVLKGEFQAHSSKAFIGAAIE